MNFNYKYIEFDQPMGTFYFAKVPALELLDFFTIRKRRYTGDEAVGTQRSFSKSRVKEIGDYTQTMDCAFPTSILISLSKSSYRLKPNNEIEITGKGEIVDGQHRVLGIQKAVDLHGEENFTSFDLPVVFILEATEEQKAYVFATINGKQTKVPKSLVYDLFGVSETEDPFTICHQVARSLNFKEGSPFFRKLKMLGSKMPEGENESLSQGTVVDYMLKKMTNTRLSLQDRDLMRRGRHEQLEDDEKLVLRRYLKKPSINKVLKLMLNIFSAVRDIWEDEWDEPDKYILSKSTGYIGIMKGIDEFLKLSIEAGDVSYSRFYDFFDKVDKKLQQQNLKLTSDDFPSGATGQGKLRDILKEVTSGY